MLSNTKGQFKWRFGCRGWFGQKRGRSGPARARLVRGRSGCSTAMVRQGAELAVPDFVELSANDDDEGVQTLLSHLLGIPENMTDVPMDSSRESYDANISEARSVGIFPSEGSGVGSALELLRSALGWEPTPVPKEDGRRVAAIEDEIVALRERRREFQRRIDVALQYAKRAERFQSEAGEQRDRLTSIRALRINRETGEWQWPFAEANLGLTSLIARTLLAGLESLDREMTAGRGAPRA